jgi:hypothetical protein
MESRDTGCYLYAVVRASTRLPADLRGLDDATVELLPHDDIAAAVTPMALDRPPGRRAELLAHAAVVDRLAEGGPVVPVQFGSVLADRDSVLGEVLRPRHTEFVEMLDRFTGHVQFNLRASYVEEEILAEVVRDRRDIAELRKRTRDLARGSPHPDLVRLGELVADAMEKKRAVDADRVLAVVQPRVVDTTRHTGSGVDDLLDAALLVPGDQVAGLEEDLESFAAEVHKRIRLRLAGPTAPYDFVGEQAWA